MGRGKPWARETMGRGKPSFHRPPRAFYFSIVAIFIGIPNSYLLLTFQISNNAGVRIVKQNKWRLQLGSKRILQI